MAATAEQFALIELENTAERSCRELQDLLAGRGDLRKGLEKVERQLYVAVQEVDAARQSDAEARRQALRS